MTRRADRRAFLAAAGTAGLTALAGCSAIRSRLGGITDDLPFVPGLDNPAFTVLGGELPEAIEETGTYTVIVPGADGENILTHYYRAESGGITMESEAGGLTSAEPTDAGVELRVDLTEDDVYGSAGFSFGPADIGKLGSIKFEANSEISVGLLLGIAYNDETIAAWEPVGGGRERRTGFDGDDRALSGYLAAADIPITRSDPIWSIPPNGGGGEHSDLSIDDLQNMFGNIPVGVAGGIDGTSGVSRDAVVQRLVAQLDN